MRATVWQLKQAQQGCARGSEIKKGVSETETHGESRLSELDCDQYEAGNNGGDGEGDRDSLRDRDRKSESFCHPTKSA